VIDWIAGTILLAIVIAVLIVWSRDWEEPTP
jgi:hypothetical protein